jgi:hypothetical protein
MNQTEIQTQVSSVLPSLDQHCWKAKVRIIGVLILCRIKKIYLQSIKEIPLRTTTSP